MHFFCIFIKNFNKPTVNFLRVWTKNANCWEILRKFWKFLMKILLKNWIFIFNFIFRKFVTKNRAFGNNTSFLHQFFRFRGGDFIPFPPGYAFGQRWNSLKRSYFFAGFFRGSRSIKGGRIKGVAACRVQGLRAKAIEKVSKTFQISIKNYNFNQILRGFVNF